MTASTPSKRPLALMMTGMPPPPAPELRVERADRLGRLVEGRVVLVDDDLGDERGDLLVDGPPPQLVDDRPLQHEAHAALGHGVADVERIGRDLVGRLLHLDEEVPDLRPVAVDDDELVAFADEMDHELGRPLGVPHLLGLQTPLVFGQHGVAAESDEGDLRSHRSPWPGLFTSRGGCRCEASKGEAVLGVLRTLCNEADAAGSACPKGENAGLGVSCLMEECCVFMNGPGQNFFRTSLRVGVPISSSS
jgi:hypothetical protein